MFEHSIKVPRLYSGAAKIIENVMKTGVSVKSLVYQTKHSNIKALYALVVETLKHSNQLDFLFKRTQLLVKETRLNPWLARVLITELLWGKKRLSSECKPVKTVLAYQQILNAHALDVYEDLPVNTKVAKPRFVRVNTILISVKEVIDGFRDEGWTFVRYMETKNYDEFIEKIKNLSEDEFMTDIHIPELLIFPPKTEFHSHEAYRSGHILLQDKASCLPVHLLNPTPGSRVLDMCAAPGMKTSQLAAKLNNEGKVYAVDLDVNRLKTLETLMERTGVTCADAINKDILKMTNSDCPDVEYILVDPSCSGSGMIDRLDLIQPTERDDKRIEKLKGFQIMILKHALRRFPNAKRVVYSTCSLYPEENEEVVNEVLTQTSHFKLVPALELLNKPWSNFGSEKYGDIGKFCLYSKPEMDLSNGFFVAVFERLKEGEENIYLIPNPVKSKVKLDSEEQSLLHEHISNEFDAHNISNSVEGRKHKKDKRYIDYMELENYDKYEESRIKHISHNEINESKVLIKKKKRKSEHNNDVVDDIKENDSEVSNKNKKKTLNIEDKNDKCILVHDSNIEESSKHQKKKKSKDRDFSNNDLHKSREIVEIPEVSAPKKKAKRKYESINTTMNNIEENSSKERNENMEESLDYGNKNEILPYECSSEGNKKHKKKKKNTLEDITYNEENSSEIINAELKMSTPKSLGDGNKNEISHKCNNEGNKKHKKKKKNKLEDILYDEENTSKTITKEFEMPSLKYLDTENKNDLSYECSNDGNKQHKKKKRSRLEDISYDEKNISNAMSEELGMSPSKSLDKNDLSYECSNDGNRNQKKKKNRLEDISYNEESISKKITEKLEMPPSKSSDNESKNDLSYECSNEGNRKHKKNKRNRLKNISYDEESTSKATTEEFGMSPSKSSNDENKNVLLSHECSNEGNRKHKKKKRNKLEDISHDEGNTSKTTTEEFEMSPSKSLDDDSKNDILSYESSSKRSKKHKKREKNKVEDISYNEEVISQTITEQPETSSPSKKKKERKYDSCNTDNNYTKICAVHTEKILNNENRNDKPSHKSKEHKEERYEEEEYVDNFDDIAWLQSVFEDTSINNTDA